MRPTETLGVNGMRSFVIGDDLVSGAVEREEPEALVDKTRERD